jgi:hypothetical protein
MGYQDFQNKLNQERQNIDWQKGAMSGLPYQGSVTQSRYTPQPGLGAGRFGAGVAALGAYNANREPQGPDQGEYQSQFNFPEFDPGSVTDRNQGPGFGMGAEGNTQGNNPISQAPQLGNQNQGYQKPPQSQFNSPEFDPGSVTDNATFGGGW